MFKQALETRKLYVRRYILYNKTLVELDLVQHQISFAWSSDIWLSFTSPIAHPTSVYYGTIHAQTFLQTETPQQMIINDTLGTY